MTKLLLKNWLSINCITKKHYLMLRHRSWDRRNNAIVAIVWVCINSKKCAECVILITPYPGRELTGSKVFLLFCWSVSRSIFCPWFSCCITLRDSYQFHSLLQNAADLALCVLWETRLVGALLVSITVLRRHYRPISVIKQKQAAVQILEKGNLSFPSQLTMMLQAL